MEEQLVAFRLGTEHYAIPISTVREIIQYKGATAVPNALEYVEGIINLRGKVISVIELSRRLGFKEGADESKTAIIIELPDREVGVVVDEVTGVIKIPSEAIDQTPSSISHENGYVLGIGKYEDKLLVLLDIVSLLSNP